MGHSPLIVDWKITYEHEKTKCANLPSLLGGKFQAIEARIRLRRFQKGDDEVRVLQERGMASISKQVRGPVKFRPLDRAIVFLPCRSIPLPPGVRIPLCGYPGRT